MNGSLCFLIDNLTEITQTLKKTSKSEVKQLHFKIYDQ